MELITESIGAIEAGQITGIVPRAVIPDFVSESMEFSDDGLTPVRRGWIHSLPEPMLGPDGDLIGLGDGGGENQRQARELYGLGFDKKAQRLACCGRYGRRIQCFNGHSFFQRFRCGLRYCPACAPILFRDLFDKHVGLEAKVVARKGWVLAALDFTLTNTGELPTPEAIRSFNVAIKKTLRRLARGQKGWGYLWVNEFGFNNTNLHAHGIYYGPWINRDDLIAAWLQETGSSSRVWIQRVRRGFRTALRHMLKYVSKPPSDNPRHLANLQAAFNGVRRVHALGSFFNHDSTDQGAVSQASGCPCCGDYLHPVSAYCPLTTFLRDGLRDVEEVRRSLALSRVFGSPGEGP